MKNKVIQFLINEKEKYNEQINDIIYNNLYQIETKTTFKSLTFGDLQKLDSLRKEIAEIYNIIDILEEKGEN